MADNHKSHVSADIPDSLKMRLNEISIELSEPGERVNISDLLREAIRDYVENYDENPEKCQPLERGALRTKNEEEVES